MKYEYLEEKVIHVSLEDGKKLDILVPLDFVITKEWLDSRLVDPKITKCEEWLKKKGFTKDEYGLWNLLVSEINGKKLPKSITLPKFFYDPDNNDLRVSFGTVLYLDNFRLPSTGSSQFGGTSPVYIRKFKNFPRMLSKETHLGFYTTEENILNSIEFDFYSYYVGFNKYERESNMYCTGIHNSKDYDLLLLDYMMSNNPSEISGHNWPDGFLDNLTNEQKNCIKSSTSINKFNL